MNEIIEKLNKVKDKMLFEKRGTLYFFGLLQRTDLENKWDIVVSSSWLEKSNTQEDLVYVINKLKDEFNNDLDFISRIVLFTASESFINDLGWALEKTDNRKLSETKEILNLKISEEVSIRHLYVLACDFSSLKLYEPIEIRSPEDAVVSF